MKAVSEKDIDHILKELEQGSKSLDAIIEEFTKSQSFFIQFLSSESFSILKDHEFDLLIFLLSVIHCASSMEEEIQAIKIEELDEKNWTILNESKSFKKAKDVYFQDYNQEDLLAFVEDSLVEVDGDNISLVGKELIFLTAKTLIDCLDQLT